MDAHAFGQEHAGWTREHITFLHIVACQRLPGLDVGLDSAGLGLAGGYR